MTVNTVGAGVVSHDKSESKLQAFKKQLESLRKTKKQILKPEPEVLIHILESLPDPYLILSPTLEIEWVNKAYLRATGYTRTDLSGKPVYELSNGMPPEEEPEYLINLQYSLKYVLENKKPHQMGMYHTEQLRSQKVTGSPEPKYWSLMNCPVVNEAGEITQILHKLTDSTALVQKQRVIEGLTLEREAIQAALGQAQFVQKKLKEEQRRLKQAETVGRLGSFEVVLPEKVVFCSDELYRIYGLEPQSEPVIFEEFITYIHPDDRDRYKTAVLAFYQEGSLNFTHRIVRQDGETRIVHTRSESELDMEGREGRIYGTMQDITEQKLAQIQLEANTAILQQAEAVGHTGSYEADVSTMTLKCSDEMYRLLGYEPQSIEITLDFVDAHSHPDDALQIRQQLEQAVAAKEPYQYVRRIYWPDGQMRYIEGKGKVVCDEAGKVVKLVGTIHDVTDQTRADLILDTINEICFELDEQLRFRYVNQLACQTWGLQPAEVLGKEYLEVFPEAKELACFQMILKVHQTRKQVLGEVYYPVENKWLFYNVMPAPTGLIVLYFDITEKVEARQEISLKQEQLHLLVENIPDLVSRWSKDGTLVYCNSAFESKFFIESGSALGKSVLDLGESSEEAISFYSCLKEVFATGQTKDRTYKFHTQQEYICLVAHLLPELAPDGQIESVLVIAYDMTQVLQAKSEIKKHLKILKQSEELAGLGSWEYDIASETFTWSEGMSRLFQLEKNLPVSPELYLKYVVQEDRDIALRIVENLRVHHQPFEETLRIRHPQGIKVLKMKGVVVEDSEGKPTKILGVDWDITEMEQLMTENLNIKLRQQNELLLAILNTQEAERSRIAEALHNGIAQLLYAVKLNLDQVNVDRKAKQDRQLKECVGKADRILIQAMKEVRTLSHELMPTPLSDLGVEAALKDICATLSTNQLRFRCWVFNLHTPLDKHIQLAIYRIAQELANNVVKHAQATEASLLLREQRGTLVLEAEDNGIGYTPGQGNGKGIGLKSIQERVKLLNGTLEIESEPDRGTTVSIYLPLPKPEAPAP